MGPAAGNLSSYASSKIAVNKYVRSAHPFSQWLRDSVGNTNETTVESPSSFMRVRASQYRRQVVLVSLCTMDLLLMEHHGQGTRCIAVHPGGIADTGMGNNAPQHYRNLLHDTGKHPHALVLGVSRLTAHN